MKSLEIRIILFITFVLPIGILSCNKPKVITPASPEAVLLFKNVIPKPVQSDTSGNAFLFTKDTKIQVGTGVQAEGQYLASILNQLTGFSITTLEGNEMVEGAINLFLLENDDTELGDEGYSLKITTDGVFLSANKTVGLFWGIQSLRQLLPERMDSSASSLQIAAGTIRDFPTYSWRGSMLDVARHFFSVEDVKRYIDYLAAYKLNVLHLHLSDDQGWRIEIKSWPNLTAHGSTTEVGGGEGGYYTQKQYSEIVAYAQERHITVIPEIDLPGHTNAALASYPELNCNGKAPQLYTGTEVGFSTLCIDKEITFKFVDDVIGELAAITPGAYIHIGGDEAAATKKKDYITFVNRFYEIVEKHGKIMIGWEEIAQGKIDTNAIAQHWSSVEHANEAVKKGARIILSPAKKVYLDMKYDSTIKLGLKWAAYIEVDDAYNWKPETYLEGISEGQILGVESALWTETVTNMEELEFLVFPRLQTIAEVAWTPSSGRDWNDYKSRLGNHGKRMAAMGIDFYHSPEVQWKD